MSWNDPIGDMRKAFQQIRDARWVCMTCGHITRGRPERYVTLEELRAEPRALTMQPLTCICGSTAWIYRNDPE